MLFLTLLLIFTHIFFVDENRVAVSIYDFSDPNFFDVDVTM